MSLPEPMSGRAGSDRQRVILIAFVGVVLLLRVWFCARLPVNTGDILRWIHVALYVLRDGPAVLATPLVELDPGLAALSWARVPYSYPPLALPFFVLVAGISPTLFAVKLGLTLVEACNALLITRISGSRWLGAIYFASPASIWWASGEGQFEPLMALCILGAIHLSRTAPVAAFAVLALGVHVKITAILLLPWLVWRARSDSESLLPGGVAFVVSLAAPLAVGSLFYPVVESLVGIGGTVRYNPYHWNVLSSEIFLWNPGWLRVTNALASYGALAGLCYLGASGRYRWIELSAPIAFIVLVKSSSLAQFWYFLLFPSFAMALSSRDEGLDVRFLLVALAPLLDVRSLVELVAGPFGWIEVGTYDGLTAFTPFGIR